MEEPEEKCDNCGRPTPSKELELWGGVCSRCAGMEDSEEGDDKE